METREYICKLARACQVVLVLAMSLFFAQHLGAQTITGTILGNVVDPSGAAIPNAQVTITNQDTGSVRNALSTADGTYTVPQLPAGNYTVGAMAQGFNQVQVKDVVVTVGSDTRIAVSRFARVLSASDG